MLALRPALDQELWEGTDLGETQFGPHAGQSPAGKTELHLAQSLGPGHVEGPWPGAGQTWAAPSPTAGPPTATAATPFPVVGLSLGLGCLLCEQGTVMHPGREEAEGFREKVCLAHRDAQQPVLVCRHLPQP